MRERTHGAFDEFARVLFEFRVFEPRLRTHGLQPVHRFVAATRRLQRQARRKQKQNGDTEKGNKGSATIGMEGFASAAKAVWVHPRNLGAERLSSESNSRDQQKRGADQGR